MKHNQHYIPAGYLRLWKIEEKNNKNYVYIKDRNTNWRKKSVKRICSGKDLYELELNDGIINENMLENMLAIHEDKDIRNLHKVICTFNRKQKITMEDKEFLVVFLLKMLFRNPENKKIIGDNLVNNINIFQGLSSSKINSKRDKEQLGNILYIMFFNPNIIEDKLKLKESILKNSSIVIIQAEGNNFQTSSVPFYIDRTFIYMPISPKYGIVLLPKDIINRNFVKVNAIFFNGLLDTNLIISNRKSPYILEVKDKNKIYNYIFNILNLNHN